ncbi:MAG: glycosyltransferase, partial [Bacteroidetes bacterium]|nr:glycosyltransferase [Bacteroidota bacterium]
LDAANVEYDIHRRVAQSTQGLVRKWWAEYEYRKLYPQELSICREQAAIFLTSQRDKELLEPDVPGVPKFVVPNGVDTEYFQLPERSPEENTLVFTGAINYFPNTEGIEYFIRDIFPLIQRQVPGVRLYVVGNAPPESVRRLASPDIVVTGYVPDVRPYVQRASVYVVPLRIGGGTRLKVLEAMSMRRPIVTTSIGCEGIDVQNGETAFIADDPAAFADATVRLLADRRLRQAMADRGRMFVRERYDWSVVCSKLEEGYAAISRTAMPKGVVNA